MTEKSTERSVSNDKSHNEEIENIPEIRFPEFNGEWIETTLNDVTSDACYGVGAAATDFDGENKYLRITDIDDESHKFVPSPLVSPEGTIEEKYLVKENDLLFARTGASVGKSYLYDKKDGKLIYAGFLIKFNVSKANPKFVFYNTCKSRYDNWVRIMSMRSGQPGINLKEYQKYAFKIPSEHEQKKIADFLSIIDKKIELMEKKHNYLFVLKNYFLKTMFCYNENIPQIRLPHYENEWLNLNISDILEICYGKDYKDLNEGNIPVLGTGGIISHVDSFLYDKETVMIGRKGTINKPIYYDRPFWTVDTLFFTKIKEGYYPKFVYYLFNTINWLKYNEATGVPSLTSNNIKKIKVKCPSYQEQKEISELFSSLDKKIKLLEKEIEIQNDFKKVLLSKMFC